MPKYSPQAAAPRHPAHASNALDRLRKQIVQLKAALRKYQALWRGIEYSQDCITVLDLEGRVLSVNHGCRDILEAACHTTPLGTPWIEIWPEEYRRAAREALVAACAGGVGRFMGPLQSAEGNPTWWDVVVSPMFSSGRMPRQLLAAARDVTEYKTAEARREELLHESSAERALFEAVLRQMPAGAVIAAYPSGEFVLVNDQFSQILQDPFQPAAEVQQYKAYKLYYLDGRPYEPEEYPIARALIRDEVVQGEELIYEGGSGTRATLLVDAAPVRNERGQKIAAIATFIDITEKKQTEAELRELNEMLDQRVAERTGELERRNREMQELAYVAAHDLQEPLRKARTYSDLVVRNYQDQLDEQGRYYLGRIDSAVKRLTELVADLHAFSSVGTRDKSFQRVDLNRVVDDVLRLFELSINETGGRIEVEPLPVIEADPLEMRRLIEELIDNALKFHKPGLPPVVHVGCSIETESGSGRPRLVYRLAFQDNGIGFEEKYADRIYKPFQRLHTRDNEGTGIGLAISCRIVERHGGTIRAHSVPGEGSTFEILLPVKQDTASVAPE